MIMGFQSILTMNKHEIYSNFVRFGIYFKRKLCFVATRALYKRNIAIKTCLTSVAQW